jgi:hypothetical protein
MIIDDESARVKYNANKLFQGKDKMKQYGQEVAIHMVKIKKMAHEELDKINGNFMLISPDHVEDPDNEDSVSALELVGFGGTVQDAIVLVATLRHAERTFIKGSLKDMPEDMARAFLDALDDLKIEEPKKEPK